MVKGLINFSTIDIAESIKNIGEFCNYLLHPAKILWSFWNFSVELSFIICLAICLFSVLMSIFGNNKYKRLAYSSFLVYLLIQCVNSALR